MPREEEHRGRGLPSFHELTQRRIQRVLLVSSLYDSFIMSEEGHLQETLLSHFIDLNLSHTPDLVQVTTGAEALGLLARGERVDLVVASLQAGDRDAARLALDLRAAGHDVPVVALAYSGRELHEFVRERDTSPLERIFLWQGDVRIFLAIVKHLEDRLNAENDVGRRGVPAILVVEDGIRYYSSFLPAIYSELYAHTLELLSKELNLSQKMLRLRARPKVLLATTYEEAWSHFERYQEQMLGVVSDVEFPRGGALDAHAGLELCRRALAARPGIRVVLQSSDAASREEARSIDASFLLKGSPTLLHDLRKLLVERFGFGDFVFRAPDATRVARARDLDGFVEKLRAVPAETVAYHAERDHFSNWLKARTELALARLIRPLERDGRRDVEELRAGLVRLLEDHRQERRRTVIANFDRSRFEPGVSITRIGDGSLGGKARGVAFANRVLHASELERGFPQVEIRVPPSVVLSTQIFDEFLSYEGLRDDLLEDRGDAEAVRRCLEAPFPRRAVADLRTFLQKVKYPLAIRSSSLLEDSLSQPFAGVYQTFMLANNHPELDVRGRQLAQAVKRVYASTFLESAKTYLSMTSFRLEEEKMAVMVQELVGEAHGDRYYPDFAGVARSHDFYPEPDHSPEDGVAAVALGLGRSVVGGDPCVRFCPRHPRHVLGFSSVESTLATSQREFYALDLRRESQESGLIEARYPLSVAEEDGTLSWVGSTYVRDDHRIVDGIARSGVRLVTFARVLKNGGEFPLAEILAALLDRCREATGSAVEIEFAGSFPREGRRGVFSFLQLRPLAVAREAADVDIAGVETERVVCRSSKILGNGRIDDLRDVVVVDRATFERADSVDVARQIAAFDARLRAEGRPYLLVGMGRWGSADPSLGIPVTWDQIAGVRVIVEAGFEDLRVAPSQGTHFFQNLAAAQVGYLTVNPDVGDGELDWDWLTGLPAEVEHSVRLARLEEPLVCLMSGRRGEGVIARG